MKHLNNFSENRLLKVLCLFLGIVTILLLGFDFYEKNITISSIPVAIFGILSVIFVLLPPKRLKYKIIVHHQHDCHFVDREYEFTRISAFLDNNEESILVVSGCQGIGKTHLLKKAADYINYESDIPVPYRAIYISIPSQKTLISSVAEVVGLDNAFSVEDILGQIDNLGKYGNWVFILDNIIPENYAEAMELAHSILYYRPKYKVVLGATRPAHFNDLQPSKFGDAEVKLLENSYKITLTEEERNNIISCSHGLPVYIRFLLDSHTDSSRFYSLELSDMEMYIKEIIATLSEDATTLLAIISFFDELCGNSIKISMVRDMFTSTNKTLINELCYSSLISINNNDIIVIEAMIAKICRDVLSSQSTEANRIIYDYFRIYPKYEHIALWAYLRVKKDVNKDQLVKRVFYEQHYMGNYRYFVYVGRDYLSGKINLGNYCSKCTLHQFWYYYFDSLLQLGLYPEARKALDAADGDTTLFGGILEAKTEVSIDTHYMMIDLEHLTNHFDTAANLCVALKGMCDSLSQKNKCDYLYAHCLKHMGRDLPLSESIFSGLADDNIQNNISQKIRALYSCISIHLFWMDNNYDYDNKFKIIRFWLADNKEAEKIFPNFQRHYANYLELIKSDYDKAKDELIKAIAQLEKKPQRIIYDIYFELGEWYRREYSRTGMEEDLINARIYLNKAITFAEESGDYNLESMAKLSLALLIRLESPDAKPDDKLLHNIELIAKKANSLNLNINQAYAIYTSHVFCGEQIPEEQIHYWQKLQYLQIVCSAKRYNDNKDDDIRLIVM